MIEPRTFNTIEIDNKRGILTKYSQNIDKFLNEISWYINLPSNLQYFIPRIYSYSMNKTKPYIQMELYGYNTLHDFLLQKQDVFFWKQVFNQLKYVLDEMQNFKYFDKTKIKTSLQKIYIDKTITRLNELKTIDTFSIFFEKQLYLNNEVLYDINTIIKLLNTEVKKILIDEYDDFFTIIHGDLCLSNIFYENKYNFLKLIDPRGNFGEFKLFGDKRYELAKLFHSIEGGYDYIIEDLFMIEYTENKVKYELYNNSKFLVNILKNIFNISNKEYKIIKLIESLLFLSMIPLHNESIDRQMAMFATGNKLFFEVING